MRLKKKRNQCEFDKYVERIKFWQNNINFDTLSSRIEACGETFRKSESVTCDYEEA